MNKAITLLAAAAVLFCFGSTASADLDNLDIGGDVKIMAVYTDNVIDFNDEGNYYEGDDQDDFLRIETHLWFQADLSDNVTAKVSVEVDRDFDYDTEAVDDDAYGAGYYYDGRAQQYYGGSSDDLLVYLEEAWIQFAYVYDSAISMKLGRQFIQLGDGFVVGDANPLYPMYLSSLGEYEVEPFDALNFWYDGDDWVFTLVYTKLNESRAFDNTPARGDVDAYIAYFSYTGWEGYEGDLYFIMSTIDAIGSDLEIDDGYYANGDAEVYAIGARLAGEPTDGLTFKLEALYEFGTIDVGDDVDIKAWAVEAGIKYAFDNEYNPFIGFTYVFQSGDDDYDDDFETYIPLFENRVYGEIFDPYTWGNLHIFNLYGGFDLSEDVALAAKYYYFLAVEKEDMMYGWDDESLGHEFDVYLDYQFSEETSAMLAAGVLIPDDGIDDTFAGGDADMAWFVRAGVKVEF